MITLEERLTEIVEKEQSNAIIPFLQGLTQEERKSLIPCLSRLEEYYNKFVQLEEMMATFLIDYSRILVKRFPEEGKELKVLMPLLFTPTHAPMFISPAVLIQRIKQYQQADIEPDDIDMQMALSRVALDDSLQVLPFISQELEGEFRNPLIS